METHQKFLTQAFYNCITKIICKAKHNQNIPIIKIAKCDTKLESVARACVQGLWLPRSDTSCSAVPQASAES